MQKLRRLALIGFLLALTAVTAAPAAAEDATVKKQTVPCGVGWDAGPIVWDDECDVTNIRSANGGITLVIHGQVPEDRFDDFAASGVRHFSVGCWVNYLFVRDDGEAPVVVDSVIHFTPNGRMTQTCHFRPTA
jgi:hypothetical protein